jgi:hypothetical protein
MWKSHDFQTLWRFLIISGKISRFLNILTYFHDFWAMWKPHDF